MRQGLEQRLREVIQIFRAWAIGQLLVSLAIGLLTWGGLAWGTLPGAGWLGLMTGLLSLVPFFGLAVSLLVSLLVAVFQQAPLAAVSVVAGTFLAVQLLESLLLSPLILGRSVGVHPLGVLVALVVCGAVLGPFGVLLAVPLAALAWKWGRGLFQMPPGRSGSSSASEETPR
ncbi:MAG: AI-2E family transporter [Calditrichaeota bacterium]|nr:AI-2E family transporter [Candidatus Cloacimonadota bacterium]MCA9785867.1 AI-2E family transporter [Candidatus Cloacimonadota bacterium]MCB1047064.1 AI-2E family transporter [Calditrichota bacterium]MCB9474788.1 AI-2E family transporter [Candidatus Delongbacteria bacterium]